MKKLSMIILSLLIGVFSFGQGQYKYVYCIDKPNATITTKVKKGDPIFIGSMNDVIKSNTELNTGSILSALVFSNTMNGADALLSNTTGLYNSAFGFNTLTANTTGSYNIGFGYKAGTKNTTGVGNIYIGQNAGLKQTTGGNNVIIGSLAGQSLISGTGNIIIGSGAGPGGVGSCVESNRLYISNNVGEQDTSFIYGNMTGNKATATLQFNSNTSVASDFSCFGNIIKKTNVPKPFDSTGTATAAMILRGVITSTSAGAHNITMPTATTLAALIPSCGRGTYVDFIVDNSAGANTITVIADGSMPVITPVITGGATLTVSTANAVGGFRLYFTSGTTGKLLRLF